MTEIYGSIELKRKDTSYRSIVSVFLLILYLFVLLPVNLWHHHTPDSLSVQSVSTQQSGDENNSQIPVPDLDSDCFICSHHYAAVNLTVFEFVSQSFQSQFPEINDFCNFPEIRVSLYSDPDRGPPVC